MQNSYQSITSYGLTILLTMAARKADRPYPSGSALLSGWLIHGAFTNSTGFPLSVMTFLVLC